MLNRHVLVLNQNFKPLSVCSVKRAVVMVYLKRAEIIESLDGYKIHSVSLSLPVPSVVRLGIYVRVPVKRIMLTRKNIIKRDNSRCQYCGRIFPPTDLTWDHVLPRARGGKTEWGNIVACCIECNKRKGGRIPSEVSMTLIRKPRRPEWLPILTITLGFKHLPQSWRDYIYWNVELEE